MIYCRSKIWKLSFRKSPSPQNTNRTSFLSVGIRLFNSSYSADWTLNILYCLLMVLLMNAITWGTYCFTSHLLLLLRLHILHMIDVMVTLQCGSGTLQTCCTFCIVLYIAQCTILFIFICIVSIDWAVSKLLACNLVGFCGFCCLKIMRNWDMW